MGITSGTPRASLGRRCTSMYPLRWLVRAANERGVATWMDGGVPLVCRNHKQSHRTSPSAYYALPS